MWRWVQVVAAPAGAATSGATVWLVAGEAGEASRSGERFIDSPYSFASTEPGRRARTTSSTPSTSVTRTSTTSSVDVGTFFPT